MLIYYWSSNVKVYLRSSQNSWLFGSMVTNETAKWAAFWSDCNNIIWGKYLNRLQATFLEDARRHDTIRNVGKTNKEPAKHHLKFIRTSTFCKQSDYLNERHLATCLYILMSLWPVWQASTETIIERIIATTINLSSPCKLKS